MPIAHHLPVGCRDVKAFESVLREVLLLDRRDGIDEYKQVDDAVKSQSHLSRGDEVVYLGIESAP